MTIQEVLHQANIGLLDAEVLLAHLLGVSREKLITQKNQELTERQQVQWSDIVQRRKNNEPVAYITGQKEFYGRDFHVTPDVLIPRPATEHLIDACKKLLVDPKDSVTDADTDIVIGTKIFGDCKNAKTIVDIGTGSGCIAITLALETELDVIAIDISEAALDVAKMNAETLGVTIDFRLGDLCKPIDDVDEPFIAVSNPPYIPESENLMPDVERFEPHLALFSGKDGADSVVKIYNSLSNNPNCKALVMECKKDQWEYELA